MRYKRIIAKFGTNLLTGEVTRKVREGAADYLTPAGRPLPDHLLLSGGGDAIYLVWGDGALQRFDARDLSGIQLAESLDVLEQPGPLGKQDAALVIVISDGHENSSKRVTQADLVERMQKLEATDQWTFSFLMATRV